MSIRNLNKYDESRCRNGNLEVSIKHTDCRMQIILHGNFPKYPNPAGSWLSSYAGRKGHVNYVMQSLDHAYIPMHLYSTSGKAK